MIVEIPKNPSNKYEYDGARGVFWLDRPQFSQMRYPGDYGFILGTLNRGDNPLDVLCLVDHPQLHRMHDRSASGGHSRYGREPGGGSEGSGNQDLPPAFAEDP
jgi:inorganic pyrophosphatase